ncbi:MAG: DUF2259 domain-containing protein [Treponema sp.]|nr:DUF2259 domain-containing protein [Treponema sp.]
MKRILVGILCTALAASVFAGDAAVFSDIGFSEDGLTYVFGQYGKTDVKYQAWAEIYTVDVRENDYVEGGVFRTKPTSGTSSISGKKAFEDLIRKSRWFWGKYGCNPSQPANLLYVRESEEKKPTDTIIFKDFESSTEEKSIYYHITLVPEYFGEGKKVESKFYINLEKMDSDGNVLDARKIGTPDLKRKGVSNYRIDRIFTDSCGKSLIFIVEKTVIDDTGKSIRYMVEAARF